MAMGLGVLLAIGLASVAPAIFYAPAILGRET